MPQKPTAKPQRQPDTQLLDELEQTPDENLGKGVIATEGANGSTLEPVYSSRKMRCYSVTESELRQLGIANIGITAFFSLGSACFAFAVDIFKDTLLTEKVPEAAVSAIKYAQPMLLSFGVVFWVIAGIALFWRRGMIKLIKDESSTP